MHEDAALPEKKRSLWCNNLRNLAKNSFAQLGLVFKPKAKNFRA